MSNLLSSTVCHIIQHFPFSPTERMWLSPGSPYSSNNAGGVLHYGLAMVRGCDRLVHLPCEQPEGGVRLLGAGRTAQVSGHSGAAGHRIHDFYPHGLLCFHDLGAEGEIGGIMFHFTV